jgi:hypothetical protein
MSAQGIDQRRSADCQRAGLEQGLLGCVFALTVSTPLLYVARRSYPMLVRSASVQTVRCPHRGVSCFLRFRLGLVTWQPSERERERRGEIESCGATLMQATHPCAALSQALVASPAFFNFFLQSELTINACAQKRRAVDRLTSASVLLPPR